MATKVDIPVRQGTERTNSDDAVPTGDPMDTSTLLAERLQAWKHAVGYLEDYIAATEKVEKSHGKEYEKVLKTITNPLREGHHFDQSLGGVAGLLENMRTNTQGLANSHAETAKNIDGSVLPILARLHKEIKAKAKELESGALKGAKEVEKARNTTQKHIELLGQRTAGFESASGKVTPAEDPYVLQRGVYNRLHKQILEENNNHQDLVNVQNNFLQFETHVIEVIQQAIASFNQFVGGQAQRDQTCYADILGTAQRIPPDFEWKGFIGRSGSMLMDPNAPPRSVDQVAFPNQNHAATQPMIEGTLERKSRNILSHGYSTDYYVVTPSKFLHQFKDNDNMRHDPQPVLSIYLPDAVIGGINGTKFNVKGKDVSKGLSGKLTGSTELAFKAHTPTDAEKWNEVIKLAAGQGAATEPYSSTPNSPISPSDEKAAIAGSPIDSKRQASGSSALAASPVDSKRQASGSSALAAGSGSSVPAQPHVQTQGITGTETVASPVVATPVVTAPPTAVAAPAAAVLEKSEA